MRAYANYPRKYPRLCFAACRRALTAALSDSECKRGQHGSEAKRGQVSGQLAGTHIYPFKVVPRHAWMAKEAVSAPAGLDSSRHPPAIQWAGYGRGPHKIARRPARVGANVARLRVGIF